MPKKPRRPTHASVPRRRNTAEEVALLVTSEVKSRAGMVLLLLGLLAGVAAGIAYFGFLSPPSPAASPPHAGRVLDGGLGLVSLEGPDGGVSPSAPSPDAGPRPPPPKELARLLARPGPPRVLSPTPTHTVGPGIARIDPLELAKAIATDKTGPVQLCYERELKRNPRLKGRVTVALYLRAPHAVGPVRVSDDLNSARFTRCVKKALRRIDFPMLREDVSIEIPFALTSPDL